MPTKICDFQEELFTASELKFDHRWQKYTRWVTGLDETKEGGFSFIGGFINGGTVEIEIGTRKLIMVASETGSARYRSTDYRFLILQEDGSLTLTDIKENNDKKGWELRIRTALKTLLLDIDPKARIITKASAAQAAAAVEPWRFKLGFTQATYEALAIYKKRFPSFSYDEIVLMALVELGKTLIEINQDTKQIDQSDLDASI